MNTVSDFPPIGWGNYIYQCLWYLVPMAVLHFTVFVIGCAVLLLFSLRKLGSLRTRIFDFGVFLGLLLIVGSLMNGIWGCLIYNHLYHSADYIFDFSPFWPVTMNADRPRVDIYGTTLLELNAVWF